jgi:hypothetical protein
MKAPSGFMHKTPQQAGFSLLSYFDVSVKVEGGTGGIGRSEIEK